MVSNLGPSDQGSSDLTTHQNWSIRKEGNDWYSEKQPIITKSLFRSVGPGSVCNNSFPRVSLSFISICTSLMGVGRISQSMLNSI